MGLGGFQFGDRRYQELTTRPHRSEQEFNQEKGATERQKCETDCFQLRFWIPSGYLGGGDLPPECRETKQAAVLLRAVGKLENAVWIARAGRGGDSGPGRCGGNLGIWESANNCAGT